jgi:RNA polymerase sigma factor (sigma-70 family)
LINEEENIDSLIRGCKKNDRKAQELLYRNFYRVMMSLCLRYTRDERDALEVLNTGFYKVFRSLDRYDAAKATFYTWIRTIIINTCLDFIKAKTGRTVQGELDQAVSVDVPPDVFGNMSATEILKMVRQLPPATQAVFNLYAIEGYSHREIGELMKISAGTSKWHLSEARKILQLLIKKQEDQA